jgi:hypothetical protein
MAHPLAHPLHHLSSSLTTICLFRPFVCDFPSYATSVVFSFFTLSSSTTDGSSAPSALFNNHKPLEESKTSAFSTQLKKLSRDISALDSGRFDEDSEKEESDREVRLFNEVPASLTSCITFQKSTISLSAYGLSLHQELTAVFSPLSPGIATFLPSFHVPSPPHLCLYQAAQASSLHPTWHPQARLL